MQFVRPVGLRERLSTKELISQLGGAFTYGQIMEQKRKGNLLRVPDGTKKFPWHIHDVNRWLKNFNQGR